MKKLLVLFMLVISITLLSACTKKTNQLMFVTDEIYDASIDVTTVTVYFLPEDESFDAKIIGTEYEVDEDGYVCVYFTNTRTVITEDGIEILKLNECN